MNPWRLALFLWLAQLPASPAPPRTGSGSIEGVVFRLGTSDPISGVDLELTETTIPLAAGPGSTPPLRPAPFTAKSGTDGRFAFRGLPSGSFKLVAARPDPLLQNAPSPGTQTREDGTFDLPPITPGRFRVYVFPMLLPNNPGLLAGLPPGPPGLRDLNAYVKSIKAGNADVLDTGVLLTAETSENMTLEIVLGTNAGAVEGVALNDQRQPVGGAVVGLIPAAITARGFRMDMYKSTSTDAAGRFQMQGLPPGEYKVFSWEDIDKNALIDLDYMRQFENKGTTIRVNEGEKPTVEVAVIPAQ